MAPHFEFLSSLRMMLFLVPHFFLVFSICALYDGVVYRKDTPGGCSGFRRQFQLILNLRLELFATFAIKQVVEDALE